MRIAVIGMGNVGTALGRRWAEAGHQVTFCVRDPDDPKRRAGAQSMPAAIAPMDAASEAEAILLAVPWDAVPEALRAAGNLSGKVLLDCTNPVNKDFTELTIGHTTSGGEKVAQLVPQARVVKIFNTNGSKNMADPNYGVQRGVQRGVQSGVQRGVQSGAQNGSHKVTMLYAGDDASANELAALLASQIGFEPIWLGRLKEARLLEPLAIAWIVLARHRGLGRDFALDVVRRPQK